MVLLSSLQWARTAAPAVPGAVSLSELHLLHLLFQQWARTAAPAVPVPSASQSCTFFSFDHITRGLAKDSHTKTWIDELFRSC